MSTQKFRAVLQLHSATERDPSGGRVMLFLPEDRSLLHDSDTASYVEFVLDTPSDELLGLFGLNREERRETLFELTIRQLNKQEAKAMRTEAERIREASMIPPKPLPNPAAEVEA